MARLLILFALLPTTAHAEDYAAEQAALDRSVAFWNANGIDDYDFLLNVNSNPSDPGSGPIAVRDGVALNERAANRLLSTVPKLYAVIQAAIDRRAPRIDVHYGLHGEPQIVVLDGAAIYVPYFRPIPAPAASIADGSAAAALAAARERWRQRKPRRYRLRAELTCDCRGGVGFETYRRMPALFAAIERAIAAGHPVLDVRYGAQGVPRHIRWENGVIDPAGVTATSFEVRVTRLRLLRSSRTR